MCLSVMWFLPNSSTRKWSWYCKIYYPCSALTCHCHPALFWTPWSVLRKEGWFLLVLILLRLPQGTSSKAETWSLDPGDPWYAAWLTTVCSSSHLIALIKDSSGRGPRGTSSAFSISAKGQGWKGAKANQGKWRLQHFFLTNPSAPWCCGVVRHPNQSLYIPACSYSGLKLINW